MQTPSFFFIKECAFGTYGQDCSMVCGQCREMSDCSNVNGICESGCNPGYIGFNCKEGLGCFACIYCNISKALSRFCVCTEIICLVKFLLSE